MDKFIRIDEVMKITGLAKSTVWDWVKKDKLPTPIKLSPRVTVWSTIDMDTWVSNQISESKSEVRS